MSKEFPYSIRCPYPNCGKGEVRSDTRTQMRTSEICEKCHNAFIADWMKLKAYPAKKIRRR